MNSNIFQGCVPALMTPCLADRTPNYSALVKKGQADYYIGTCWSGGGGALAAATAILGAKRVGASPLALIGATLGAIIGIFFGLVGIIFGPFIGAFAGEFIARGRLGEAGKVGIATWLGLVLGTLAKLAIVFVMLALFVASFLLNPVK